MSSAVAIAPTSRSTQARAVPWPVPVPDEGVPYVRLGDYLGDLVREVQAEVAFLGTRREAAAGSRTTDDEAPEVIAINDLTADDCAALATGSNVARKGRDWTVATLATAAVVPVGQWKAIVEHAHARRVQRTSASRSSHPAQRLREFEQQLGEPLATIARLMAVSLRPSNQSMLAVVERFQIGTAPNVEKLLNLLYPDPEDWLDIVNALRAEHPLFASGVCDWWRSGPPSQQTSLRELVAGTGFMAACIGRMVPPADGPGVVVVQPTVDLAEVVLAPQIREQIEHLRCEPGRGTSALGILIHGPSGTGKTMLANALAKRAGRRLVLIEPDRSNKELFEEDDLATTIDMSLRRATVNGDIVCLDEAHELLRAPGVLRLMLTALEQTPAVVILVTTMPECLDSALDRRLPVRLHLDVPGAEERLAILRQEMAHQQVTTTAAHEDLTQIAHAYRLTGGWWRSAVRLAAMQATSQAGPGPVTAVQMRHQASVAQQHAARGCWPPGIGLLQAPDLDLAPRRMAEIAQVAAAMQGNHCGGVLLVRGSDRNLIEASCVRLADLLGRTAVTVGSTKPSRKSGQDDTIGLLTLDLLTTPTVALLMPDVAPDNSELPRLLQQAALGQHLVVVPVDTMPASINRDGVIATVAWGVPLPEELAAAWKQAGGPGAAPVCSTIAGVHAEAIRCRLGAFGGAVNLP